MPDKKLTAYLNTYKSYFFKKHEIILSAGHSCDYIFFIKEGIVNDYLINSTGNAFIVNWTKPNEFFPLSVFNNEKLNNYYQALSNVKIKRVPKKNFLTFIEKNPEVMMLIGKKMEENFLLVLERLEHFLMSERIEERLEYLILQLAKQFGISEKTKTIINMHLTHNDLASYIGATRESVTRCLASLTKSRVLKLEKERIVIVDVSLLEQRF